MVPDEEPARRTPGRGHRASRKPSESGRGNLDDSLEPNDFVESRDGRRGEEFTYDLKHHGRATVVGETTAGAGHGGGVHAVAA
jgi:hypothetical protein